MSIEQGRKIVEAVEALNARIYAMGESPAMAVARTLEKRPVGNKHFDQITALFKEIAASQPLLVDHTIYEYSPNYLDHRMSEWTLSFMSPHIVDYADERSLADLSPRITRGFLSKTHFEMCSREMPIIFSSEHTAFRFKTRAKEDLDYQSPDFKDTLQTGLITAYSLGIIMQENDMPYAPVVLPHPKGLFLGYAKRCDLKTYMPPGYLRATFNRPETNPGLWTTQCEIHIRTFVSNIYLGVAQRELKIGLEKFFSAPKKEGLVKRVADDYALRVCIPEKDDKSKEDIFHRADRFTDAYKEWIKTSIWRKGTSGGWAHIPGARPD